MDNKQLCKLSKIFPPLPNIADFKNILIDEDSYKYISSKEVASIITRIICVHLTLLKKIVSQCVIIDYTAGCGGNTLSFCKTFKSVIGIEMSPERVLYLRHNINLYGFSNATIINDDSTHYNNELMTFTNPDIIFIDPPWGDNWTKMTTNHRIHFGVYDFFEYFIIDIFLKFETNNQFNKLVVLKLPKNYDIEFFYNTVSKYTYSKSFITIHLYILHKMCILVLENTIVNLGVHKNISI
jgi:hypothetical protein